ncbi:unnamed protein product [Alternaria alternata]
MPPKARKRSAKAPAPLVGPWLADVLAASTEAKTATRKLNEMVEGDPGVEEQTEKAGAAQRTLIEAVTDLVTSLAIKESKPPETSHEEEVALLTLYDLTDQYRNAKDDHGKSQCIKQMQETANRLVEAGTKDMGFQVGKPWLPSAKDDEDGQKQRIRNPIESFTNDEEPPQDAFVPYEAPTTDETTLADGTIISVDILTGIAISKDNKKASDDEEMADVEEYSKEHSHGDHEDAHGDVDVEAGSQESDSSVHPEGDTSSSTVGGGEQGQGGPLGALRQPLSEVGAFCTVCDFSKPVSSFRLLWRGKGECYDCEAQEDARLRSKD